MCKNYTKKTKVYQLICRKYDCIKTKGAKMSIKITTGQSNTKKAVSTPSFEELAQHFAEVKENEGKKSIGNLLSNFVDNYKTEFPQNKTVSVFENKNTEKNIS